eukprot:maker-scaffold_35-snap-gene-0.33-mRNA-1 protein AED:0.00 eAED:0.00 QI:77/1/1/1/1/1/3/224/528
MSEEHTQFFAENQLPELFFPIVILGGGVAGGYASQAYTDFLKEDPILNQWVDNYASIAKEKNSGFSSFCSLISAEEHPPYERAAITKSLLWPREVQDRSKAPRTIDEWFTPALRNLIKGNNQPVNNAVWYENNGIELLLGHKVVEVDVIEQKLLVLNIRKGNKFFVSYERLLFCTGAKALFSSIFREEEILTHVHTVRDYADLVSLQENFNELHRSKSWTGGSLLRRTKELQLLVVGGGYIGLESAMNFSLYENVQVTVVTLGTCLFQKQFPREISKWISKYVTTRFNIKILFKRKIKKFKGNDGILTSAVFDNGEEMKADLAIVGIGRVLNTELVKNQVELYSPNGRTSIHSAVSVDTNLRSSDPAIFGAGDVICIPYKRGYRSFEHTDFAEISGKVAMKNILIDMFNQRNIEKDSMKYDVIEYNRPWYNLIFPVPNSKLLPELIVFFDDEYTGVEERFYGDFTEFDESSRGVIFGNRLKQTLGGILFNPSMEERNVLRTMICRKSLISEWKKGKVANFFKDDIIDI